MKKIVKGNDFLMRILVRRMMNGEATAFPLPACTDIHVRLVNAVRRIELVSHIDVGDDSVLVARVEGDKISLGNWALEVKGKLFGNDWRSNEYEQIRIVDSNAEADTELGVTDEGEDSVEMDTAYVIQAPAAICPLATRESVGVVMIGDGLTLGEDGRIGAEVTANVLAQAVEPLGTKADTSALEALSESINGKLADAASTTPWVDGSGWRAVTTRGCKESIGDDKTKGALGDNTIATGVNTTAKGNFSHAEGNSTTAEGENSHAEGFGGVARGSCAHAEGNETKATGANAHAEGNSAVARGDNSHAEGYMCTASGKHSHAEGDSTTAIGNYSHAEGGSNMASGSYSHAEGNGCDATGAYSHAEGQLTSAIGFFSHAEGTCNYADKSFVSSIGVGSSYTDRKNAVSVLLSVDSKGSPDASDPRNGYVYVYGVGGYKGQAVEEGMKSVQEVVAGLSTKEDMSSGLASKADLEDGNVPTAQLGNVAAIADERIKAKEEESYFSIRFTGMPGEDDAGNITMSGGGTVTIDGQTHEVEQGEKVTFYGVPTTLEINGVVSWLDVSNLNTSKLMKTCIFGEEAYPFLTTMDVSRWDTSESTDMSKTFYSLSLVQYIDIGGWDTSKVTSMEGMFEQCDSLHALSLCNCDTSKVTSMSSMFSGCSSLRIVLFIYLNTAAVTNMHSMFDGCSSLWYLDVSNFNTAAVTDMAYMFRECSSLKSLDVLKWDTSKVTNMYGIFDGCTSLWGLDVSNFNTAAVTNMHSMFDECSSLNRLDVSNFNTAAVTDMVRMFYGCSSLWGLDVSNFNTAAVTNMVYMFYGCSSLKSLGVSKWDTSKVTSMEGMFRECSSLKSLDVSKWDTSKVTSMAQMFLGCAALSALNVSSWDTSKVTSMTNMFIGCTSLSSLTLGEGFGRSAAVTEIDFSPLARWTDSTVHTLLKLYDRKTNGLKTMTLKLSSATAAALGDDGKTTLEGRGYAVEVVKSEEGKAFLVV